MVFNAFRYTVNADADQTAPFEWSDQGPHCEPSDNVFCPNIKCLDNINLHKPYVQAFGLNFVEIFILSRWCSCYGCFMTFDWLTGKGINQSDCLVRVSNRVNVFVCSVLRGSVFISV